jgi:hypothetical protein
MNTVKKEKVATGTFENILTLACVLYGTTGTKQFDKLTRDFIEANTKLFDTDINKKYIHRSLKYFQKLQIENITNHTKDIQELSRQKNQFTPENIDASIKPILQDTDWHGQLIPNRKDSDRWVSDHVPCFQQLNVSDQFEQPLRCITWNVLSKPLANDSFCYCDIASGKLTEFVNTSDKDKTYFDTERVTKICEQVLGWLDATETVHLLITLVEMDYETALKLKTLITAQADANISFDIIHPPHHSLKDASLSVSFVLCDVTKDAFDVANYKTAFANAVGTDVSTVSLTATVSGSHSQSELQITASVVQSTSVSDTYTIQSSTFSSKLVVQLKLQDVDVSANQIKKVSVVSKKAKYGTFVIMKSSVCEVKYNAVQFTDDVMERCDTFTLCKRCTGETGETGETVANLCTVHMASGGTTAIENRQTQIQNIIAFFDTNKSVPLIITGDRNCSIQDFTKGVQTHSDCIIETPTATNKYFTLPCGYSITTFRLRGAETDQAMKMFELFACQMMGCASIVRSTTDSTEQQNPQLFHLLPKNSTVSGNPGGFSNPTKGLCDNYPYPLINSKILEIDPKIFRDALLIAKGSSIQEKIDDLKKDY